MDESSIIAISDTPPQPAAKGVPALFAEEGSQAAQRFIEFFAANIRNRNTRAACARAPPARSAQYSRAYGRDISLAT